MKLVLDVSVLSFNDHIDFEDETGVSVADAIRAMIKQQATAKQQRALVWVFGRKFDESLSLLDAGEVRPADVEWTAPQGADERVADGS